MTPLASLAVVAGTLATPLPVEPVDALAAAACADADVVPTTETLDDARRATRCLLNHERATHGLRGLRVSSSLSHAAQRHSRSMTDRHYFGHVSPGGSTLSDRVKSTAYLDGARAWRLGETLAWGARRRGTPEAIVNALMHSPPHADIILTASFRDVGVGVVADAPVRLGSDAAAATYTVDFGVRD